MIVVIQSVSQEFTKTGKEYRKITGITGDGKQTTKSIFDNLKDKWELLIENTTLEFTMEKKGQFWNVIDIKKPELPSPQKPYEAPVIVKPIKPDRDLIIESQVAIKAITELWAAGKLTEDSPFIVALKIWLSEKLNPYMMPTPPKEKDLPTPSEIRGIDKSEPQTFAELRAWAVTHGKEFTLSWMVNSLKIPEAELRADPNESYRIIKAHMKWEK